MRSISLLSTVLVLAFAGCLAGGADVSQIDWDITTEASSTLPTSKSSTTSRPTTTTEFSPTSTTTTRPTTTDFFPTSTSTEIPSSTTSVPSSTTTLSSTTTSTTTEAPITSSTTPATTTTPATPKPNPPNPSSGVWSVSEGNVTCILVKLAASFVVPYKTNEQKVSDAKVFLPGNATSNGSCIFLDSNFQAISLSWRADEKVPRSHNKITFMFQRNNSHANDGKDQFFVSEVIAEIYPDQYNFPNASSTSHINAHFLNANIHQTNVNNSYRCNAEEILHLDLDHQAYTNETSTNEILVRLTHVQIEAFRSENNEKFSAAVDCAADGMMTSDIVPIAVGCALAALVVVVLIAYLIGRRRARQRGYQSV